MNLSCLIGHEKPGSSLFNNKFMISHLHIYLFMIVAICYGQLPAQSGISMQSTYTSSAIEDPTDLAKCANGDVVATGNLLGSNFTSGIAFRTDSLGVPIWSFTYSASVSLTVDRATETLDGGLCFMGSVGDVGVHDTNYITLIKTNSLGQVFWTSKLTGSFGTFATGTDFYQGTDSCFYICGYVTSGSNSTPIVLKADPAGQLRWMRSFNTGNTRATTMTPNDADRLVIGILDSANGDLAIVELDTAGTLTNSTIVTHSAGSPIVNVPSCTYNIAATYYQFCVNSDIPYMNMTNWTLDITSSLQLVNANPFYRSDGILHLVKIMPSSTYANVFLLSSTTGFSHTLTQDPDASIFSIGCFIDTLSRTYPVSFKYLNNHVMMVLTEDTAANGEPDGFMLTRTLNPVPLYSDIPTDGCHMRGSGALSGSEGFSWFPGSVTVSSLTPQSAMTTILINSTTYSMMYSTNCSMVDVGEQHESPIRVYNLLTSSDQFIAVNLPVNVELNIYDTHGRIAYRSENYQNELSGSQLSPGMYLYEFILPDQSRKTGKLIVQ